VWSVSKCQSVQISSKHLRSRLLRDSDTHEHLSAFTQFGSFRHESESTKVHVGSRDDSDVLLASANEVVSHNVGLQTGKGQSPSGLRDGSSF
jgi:hypothetical protein